MLLIQERNCKRTVGLILAIAVLFAMMPVLSVTANAAVKKAPSVVKVYRSDKIAGAWPGYVTDIKTGSTSGYTTIAKGTSKKFTIKTYKGYYLTAVYLDGKRKGRAKSITVKGDGKPHTIRANFAKATLKVKVDPGHAGMYNRGYSGTGYWESIQMWNLANLLVPKLNSYPGVVATKTKERLYADPVVYDRGKMAKGNDFFISLHSNSSSSSSTDYPLSIVSYSKKQLYNVAQPIGKQLAMMVKDVMKTKQSYQVWVKKQRDGKDWYGVIRGSSDVNVPGVILEHSFHSNKKMAKWLMNNNNLNTLATKEAEIIASYYGFTASGAIAKPGKVSQKTVKSSAKKTATISWKKMPVTGYEVFRSTKQKSGFVKITNTVARSFKDKTVKSKKTYYYKVRAYRCNGKAIVYSDYDAPKAVKIK